MKINCVYEHNDNDTLLWAENLPGLYARGASLAEASNKMCIAVGSYCTWAGEAFEPPAAVEIVQEKVSALDIKDADSDVLFDSERMPITEEEYQRLKTLSLRSATEFFALYQAIPDKHQSILPKRNTFYGVAPRTAQEMYEHTKNVNSYYFAEIGIAADNEGTIAECRARGFEALEAQAEYLSPKVFCGSYDEAWTLRKVLRRFLWHDQIHAKAMLRMAKSTFPGIHIPNVFGFDYEH